MTVRRKHLSLKSRLSLMTLAVFLLGVWSVTLYTVQRLQGDMLELLGEQQFSAVATIATQLDRELQTRVYAIDRLAEAVPASALGQPSQIQSYLSTRFDLMSLFNGGVAVRDTDGNVVAMLPDAVEHQVYTAGGRDDTIAALKRGVTDIGRPLKHPISGQPVITLSSPVFDQAGNVTGAVQGSIHLHNGSFFDAVTGSKLGQSGGYLLIAPQHQLIITGSDPSRVMTPAPSAGVNLNHDRFVAGFEGYGVALNSRGIEELAAAKQIPVAGWLLVGVQSTAELTAPVKSTQQRVMAAAGLVSLFAGGMAWLLVRRTLRHQFAPIYKATQALADMARPGGVTLQPLEAQDDGEVGRLIGSFNQLIASVQSSHEALLDDIRRRQAAEAALRESENRFRTVFEHLPLATGLLDHSGRIAALNSRFVNLFGYTLADVPDFDTWKRLAYPDPAYGDQAVADWQAAVELAADTGGDIELPAYRITCKDGSIRNILISGIPLPEGVLTTFQDVTEAMQKEAALDRQHRYNDMLRRLSVTLINLRMSTVDASIHHALAQVGQFFGADRAYVFDYHLAAGTASNTHEWCAQGATPQKPLLQNLPMAAMPDWVLRHTQGEAVVIPSVIAMPPGAERDMLEPQGIKSLLTLPVMAGGVCQGFVGLDAIRSDVQFGDAERDLLALFAELLANLAERKRTDAALRRAANVFTHTHEGITITDRHGNIVDVNAAFTDITGYSREEVLGKNPRILQSGRQDSDFYRQMWDTLEIHGHWQGEVWNRHKNGSVYAELLTISSVYDEQGDVQNHIALFTDITATKTHQAELERMAHFDALTQLPNRLLLGDRLRQAMHQATRRQCHLGIAYLDLDGFKTINDTHGHEAGDQLLAALAQSMQGALREGDTLARLGGDEFVAVIVDLPDNSDSTPVFNRLIEAAASPVQLGDSLLQVTASLGITFYPQAEDIDGDQLLRQADQAMYLAKQAGKNRYHVFDAEQDRHLRGRNESLTRIQQALANQEFVLHYQPKVNMRTGEVLGTEALIRWRHPQRGLLPPGVFMPVVEGHPLGFELGEWVLDTALAQVESWIQDGLHLAVSVNVGAHQLQHPGFVRSLRDLLARHPAVRPGELELEVLETSALEDFQLVTEVMAACRALGVGFALDDFGTGYSSLTYLKRLPTDLLKIDQSFVRDMLDDPEDLAILQGVLGLSTAFHRHAIAEGVETLAHGEMLLRLGCEWGQGYAIARPMPAAEMGRWVSEWRTPPQWLGVSPTGPDRLQAVYVATEYRAWMAATVRRLREPPGAHPAARLPLCPLGRWLDEGGRTLLEQTMPDHRIDVLRQDILALADRLLAEHAAGGTQQAVNAGIDQLQSLRDQLLSELAVLYT